MKKDFGSILKKLRLKEGIGIKRLAPVLELNYTYLSKLENNSANPSEDVIYRVANYFKYDKEELLLAANKIPDDVRRILRDNPREAIEFLRNKFADAKPNRNERKPNKNYRKSDDN